MNLTRTEVITRHPNLTTLTLDGVNDYKLVDAATDFAYNNKVIWAIVNALKGAPVRKDW